MPGDRLPRAYLWDPEAVRSQERLVKRRSRWPYFLAFTVLSGVAAVQVAMADKPPFVLMDMARKAISEARSFGAGDWAPEYLKAAHDSVDAASREIDRQIGRFLTFRNFDQARRAAEDGRRMARESITVTIARRDSMRVVAADGLAQAGQAIGEARKSSQAVQMNRYTLSRLSALEITAGRARANHAAGKYREAHEKAKEIIIEANRIQHAVDDQLFDYQQNRRLWLAWADETIQWSRKTGDCAILVRKLERRCDLYQGGRLRKSYPADLGIRWMGYKMTRGDNATPEGRYHITRKKTEARYYKALEINYPNEDDWRRFQRARQNGGISKRAAIGGLIQIHGDGGRGNNWTAGCVAIRNTDMDELFRLVDVGTPVTIVGSWDGPDMAGELAR